LGDVPEQNGPAMFKHPGPGQTFFGRLNMSTVSKKHRASKKKGRSDRLNLAPEEKRFEQEQLEFLERKERFGVANTRTQIWECRHSGAPGDSFEGFLITSTTP
jgi:hypothetical protein